MQEAFVDCSWYVSYVVKWVIAFMMYVLKCGARFCGFVYRADLGVVSDVKGDI